MNWKNEFNQSVGVPTNCQLPLPRPRGAVLAGRYCVLEPLEVNKHAALLFDSLSIDNRGESWTYLPYGPFEDGEAFQEWARKLISDEDVLLYAILNAKTQRPVGVAGYLRINPAHGLIEIGHLHFSTLLRRTPAATEALYLMIRYVFEEIKYRRCEWKCHWLNEPSRRAALRLGFKFEGVFRQHQVVKGRNRDTAWFSIIDGEWPPIKTNIEKWLNPLNFDLEGKQIISLRELSSSRGE
ncbi:GNAT family N-acetyltransferase [Coxiella burnetii]|uniref:Ribosomal-protein-serine acetyltransferase n=2 Tax=Coxiella burnetii TaxID=777 RepID=Q83AH9_COXBU|nr:GNAT family protein [Coxiella burnetii]NP_820884.1 ribosomal-protein-serine acetyltransferase [Coxiella burnetii RSA 493]AAO91398.1 ribosomal-protein-serine acetyltransferase [Coxiella burnetii RSA 493]ABS77503.1 ribosomal-protein-serine acetyltransferase [Coxiella burnetii Dugway 5J108-111]ABX78140.1 acetyltransferase, GNAT family [Coxiella burnetii RSA 331]ACJ17476.1 ribosomal-protein-serine acetyltransferase [Coxiella burnetii CbuG_Q212]ACJ19343.1 ribosomal-protein-serine acetyltransfer